MTERLPQPGGYDEATARSGPLPPVPVTGEVEPTILGFPAEFADDSDGGAPVSQPDGAEQVDVQAVLRRADLVGGVALILAGVAAGMSLWLPWRRDEGTTGLTLARRGVAVLGSGIGTLGRSDLWQPLAVVLGGGLLLILGLLLLLRARSHRLVGLVALLVGVAAATGVLVPLSAVDWSPAGFGLGMWFAVAVAALGVLGALKAMLTAPLVRPRPGWPARTRFGLRTSVLRSP
jgi:hypothetical protein